MDKLLQTLRENQQTVYSNNAISVATVPTEEAGVSVALLLLQSVLNRQTVLYLSGGRTPKALYKALTEDEQVRPGAFAMVDERYGKPMHENSNEKMLRETRLLRYAQMIGIPFYSILSPVISRSEATRNLTNEEEEISHSVRNDNTREMVAEEYDQTVRGLFAQYQHHMAILGVGMDGHTAGLPATASLGMQNEEKEAWLEDLKERSKNRMIIDYNDRGGFYKERITMTYAGLFMMDVFLVLVFGTDKTKALELMFSDGSEEEVPSRFFKRPDIAKKTLLVTDQEIG